MRLPSALVGAFLLGQATVAWAYSVQFVEPAHERAYLRPAQNIEIQVQVEPTPTPLHTLVVRLNGEYVAANRTSLSLPSGDYEVGHYLLSAELQSETGQVIAQDSRAIYLIPQNNLIQQERRRQERLQAAYDDLPWYKKLYLHLRQDAQLDLAKEQTGSIGGVDVTGGARPSVAVFGSGAPAQGVQGVPSVGGVVSENSTPRAVIK